MGELSPDSAAIRLLQRLVNFTQGCLIFAHGKVAGTEYRIQIGVSQSVVVDCQVGGRRPLLQAERIKLSHLMAAHPVRLNKTQDFDLFLLMLATDTTGRSRLSAALVFGQQHEVIADCRMRYIGRSATADWQLLEIGAPFFWHSVGIVQVELVELFHIGSVTTG